MTPESEKSSTAAGLLYGLAAYLSWGVIILYFAVLSDVPPLLVLAHRIVWSVLFLAVLLTVSRQWGEVRAAIANRRTLFAMLGSTVMIAANWYTFIWAVSNHRGVDASFGYFVNPLVNVLLGVLVLKERLRLTQWTAVGLAALGVVAMTVARGGLPLASLTLAFSFGFYGLIRKVAAVRPLVGLSIETSLLLPASIVYVAYASTHGKPIGAWGLKVGFLLLMSGMVTALPLIWFAAAARRLSLTALGLMQYIAPTCQLALAVLVLNEPFDSRRFQSFGLIWLGLLVFTIDAWVQSRVRAGRMLAVSGR